MRDPSISSPAFIHLRRDGAQWRAEGLADFTLAHGPAPGEAGNWRGMFAGWRWDGTRLHAFNDRLGFLHLFYFARGDELAMSPSIDALLALGAPGELDYEALAVFMRLGWFLDSDTPFSAIRALPPAADFLWQAGKLQLTGGMVPAAPSSMARSAAIDAYIERFRAAVRRRIEVAGDNIYVPLSGGRDSRHILLELCAADTRPRACLTARYFPPAADDDADVQVARRLANRLGVPHVVLDQSAPRHRVESRAFGMTDYCARDVAWMLAITDYLDGRPGSIFDGIGGDVLSAGLFLTAERKTGFEANDLAAVADSFLGRSEAQGTQRFAASVRQRLSRSAAVDRLLRELARHRDAANPVASFVFWNRTRRQIGTSPFRILSRGRPVFAPYLDEEVFDLLSRLPASMFLDHRFHSEAIDRAFPELADIGYAERGPYPDSRVAARFYRRYTLAIVRALLTHGKSQLINRSYYLPRLARCLIDPRYADAADWIGPTLLPLLQLETASTSAGRPHRGPAARIAAIRSPVSGCVDR